MQIDSLYWLSTPKGKKAAWYNGDSYFSDISEKETYYLSDVFLGDEIASNEELAEFMAEYAMKSNLTPKDPDSYFLARYRKGEYLIPLHHTDYSNDDYQIVEALKTTM